MATTALGVDRGTDGNGLDPLSHRKIIQAQYMNTGIITGLDAWGDSTLHYNLHSGVAVCSNGDADGYTIAPWNNGGTENAVQAGDATYPRIDLIGLTVDTNAGGTVHCTAIQGTPSASPAMPATPNGFLTCGIATMPAGGSKTSSASFNQNQHYAMPYGVGHDVLATVKATTDYVVPEDNNWHEKLRARVNVPTDRQITVLWKARSSVKPGGSADDVNAHFGSYLVRLKVDGNVVNDFISLIPNAGYADEITSLRYAYTGTCEYTVPVNMGEHLITAEVFGNRGHWTYPVTIQGPYLLRITDAGLAH